jgi:hypothetical protein
MGVGLYLYSKDKEPANGNGIGKGRLSQKQHGYILKLMSENGMTRSSMSKGVIRKR